MAKTNITTENKTEVLAQTDATTTIERNEVVRTMNGVTISNFADDAKLKLLAKADKMVKDAMLNITKSTVRLAKALYYIEENELYKLYFDDKGKAFRTTAGYVKAAYGLGQTLTSNAISMYATFFKDSADGMGIDINGHPAMAYSQTQLIEMLPAMAKSDEREKVFSEVNPSMRVADVKEVVGKYHAKNERRVKSSTKNDAPNITKPLTVTDLFNAISTTLYNFDINSVEEPEQKILKELSIAVTGCYRKYYPKECQAFFETRLENKAK